MMRHKTAARRGETGGWHYVSLSRDGGHPIGYCRDHEPHTTEDEARECYGRYIREEETIRLDAKYAQWTGCQVCGAATTSGAEYGDDGYGSVALCPEHLAVEHVIAVAKLDGLAGDAWLS
jgi:hypothetical protein